MFTVSELCPTIEDRNRLAGSASLELSNLETVDLYAMISPVVELTDEPPQAAEFHVDRRELLEKIRLAEKTVSRRKAPLTDAKLEINGAVDIVTTDCDVELTQSARFDRSGEFSAILPLKRAKRILTKVKSRAVTVRIERDGLQWREELNGLVESPAAHELAAKRYFDKTATGNYRLKPADKLAELLKPAERGTRVKIIAGSAEFETESADVSEFPESKPFYCADWFTVDSAELQGILEQTEYATDCDSSRYALGGAMLECDHSTVRLVATDSRRLAFADCDATRTDGNLPAKFADWTIADCVQYALERFEYDETDIVESWNVEPWQRQFIAEETAELRESYGDGKSRTPGPVLPHSALKTVLELCKKTDAPVSIGIGADRVQFRCENADGQSWRLSTKLVDGRFPRWRDVCPDDSAFEHVERFPCGKLREALETAMIATTDDINGRKADFEFSEPNVCQLKTESAENGKATIAVATESAILGKRCDTITLDAQFILDYVKRQPADSDVYLAMIDCRSAVKMFAVHNGGELRQRYIAMSLSRER